MRDVERKTFGGRYVIMLSQDQAYLSKVDQDELAVAGGYINQDGGQALTQFKEFRDETIATLREASADRWLRTGARWSGGQVSVQDLVLRQCEHDMNHLAQVKDIVRLKMPW